MKRFISRYEKIRHLRAQQEDTCRAAAAARNTERMAAENNRNEIQIRLTECEKLVAREMSMGLSGALFQSVTSLIEKGKADLSKASEELRLAEGRLQEALVLHKQARAELKIVEEMIQRERSEHRRQQLKEQENQLQEQASQAYYREQQLSRSSES